MHMTNLPVYIFNTEHFINVTQQFDKYYLLPAGFWDAKINYRKIPINITYYDVNPNELAFKKTLIDEWDCSKEQLWQIVNDLKCSYAYSDYNLPNFYELSPREQFDENWKSHTNSDVYHEFFSIKESNVSFVLIDIVIEEISKKLHIDYQLKNYFWFSNCFEFALLHPDELQRSSFKRFIASMQGSGVYMHGIDPVNNTILKGILTLDNHV